MPKNILHIVSFENPYPPNYGGVIDVFYKIKALHKLGVQIHLHCFVSDRMDYSVLVQYCAELYTYTKIKNLLYFFSLKPLAVKFRESKLLEANLQKVKAPVLFEGLHTTSVLNYINLADRKLILRAHNIEHDYYNGLANSENGILKKQLLKIEARKFKRYESLLKKVDTVLSISHFEQEYFNKQEGVDSVYLPAFQGHSEVADLSPFGEYAFYHGDLSISDNLKVAYFLINVFKDLDYPLIIAGSKNLDALKTAVEPYSNISCKRISTKKDLKKLFAGAHINICYSYQRSGTKLKVIHSLYEGRHCVVNENVIDDPQILKQCSLIKTEEELMKAVEDLRNSPFVQSKERENALDSVYSTKKNAQKIIDILKLEI
tara:strand:+ start:54 stop:1175 length:1122 start_codon:yes stop_codon:yes gene_type:complete